MGTSSADMAARLLDGLVAGDDRFVMLHGEAEVSRGTVGSDLDVAIAQDPHAVVEQLSRSTAPAGVLPIMLWPYDRNSLTTFFADADGDCGVQLDLVCDPDGRGRYGFRTDALIVGSVAGERWPRLDPDDELLYLIRKRQVKRNRPEVQRLLQSIPVAETGRFCVRADRTFSEPARKQIGQMITSGHYVDPKGAAFDRRVRNVVSNPGFYRQRLTQTVGVWISIDATISEIEMALAPLQALLPSIVVRPPVRSALQTRTDRLRARVVVTADETGLDGRADLIVSGVSSSEEIRRAVVAGMAKRLRQQQMEVRSYG